MLSYQVAFAQNPPCEGATGAGQIVSSFYFNDATGKLFYRINSTVLCDCSDTIYGSSPNKTGPFTPNPGSPSDLQSPFYDCSSKNTFSITDTLGPLAPNTYYQIELGADSYDVATGDCTKQNPPIYYPVVVSGVISAPPEPQ